MNDQIIYQNVFDILSEVLPQNWQKVAFYAEYTEGSYSMKYYVDFGDGKYVDCYKIKGITKANLIKAFMKINKELAIVRQQLPSEKRWNVITLLVENTGKFRAEYDYEDIAENTLQYHEKWKSKYLK